MSNPAQNEMPRLPRLHVVLYQPEIPHNTGNIGRTCVAVSAKLWLVRPLGFRLNDHYLRRAGLDYWEHLDWESVDDWQQLTERLGAVNYWFFSRKGERNYTSANFTPGDVLVFGSESSGLPAAVLQQQSARCLRIPVNQPVRSLNLANSVAVAVYEAVRQWGEVGLV